MADNQSSSTGKYLTRQDFPDGFIFGAATSSYQVEGAYTQDRKGLSNWDVFSVQRPGKIVDGTNGCLAINHYNRFQEDVAMMKKLGLDAYRFSVSWSRILPSGKLNGGVNREGVKFYNDLIDLLLSNGIEPFVTLFHFDVPQHLEDEYGGFLSRSILQDYADYAEVCFFEFGDRVKFWITVNEAWSFTHNGYIAGNFPPCHGSSSLEFPNAPRYRSVPGLVDKVVSAGNAAIEPYIVAHHLILAHALAVDIYRKNYQAVQGGKIGMTNMTTWYEAYNPKSLPDVAAASRAVDFMWGWFVAPIVTGDYPSVMRERVGSRLPTFTAEEKKLITGSYDFIGMNYYTTNWAAYKRAPVGAPPTYYTDQEVEFFTERDGVPIGEQAGSPWLFIVPSGIYKLLIHTKNTYNDPLIYITENGVDEKNDTSLPITKARKDEYRIRAHQQHFAYMKQAIDNDGVNLKGYFTWAMFDNYEWTEGYSVRFGMIYVDYVNGLVRYPKLSAIWYMNFLNKNLIGQPTRQVEEISEDDNSTPKRKRGR